MGRQPTKPATRPTESPTLEQQAEHWGFRRRQSVHATVYGTFGGVTPDGQGFVIFDKYGRENVVYVWPEID